MVSIRRESKCDLNMPVCIKFYLPTSKFVVSRILVYLVFVVNIRENVNESKLIQDAKW